MLYENMNQHGEKTIAKTRVGTNTNQRVCDSILMINYAVKKGWWNFYSGVSQKDKVRSGAEGRRR